MFECCHKHFILMPITHTFISVSLNVSIVHIVCCDLYAFFVVLASRVGVCGFGCAGQCVIPAIGWDLLVSVLSSFLLLLRQLLVLPWHVLLPETPSVQTDGNSNFILRVMRIFTLNKKCLLFAVYEAGKGIKTGTSTPQTPAYPPYFMTGVPAMVPIAPPSLVDKVSTVPPSDGSMLTAGKHLWYRCSFVVSVPLVRF